MSSIEYCMDMSNPYFRFKTPYYDPIKKDTTTPKRKPLVSSL